MTHKINKTITIRLILLIATVLLIWPSLIKNISHNRVPLKPERFIELMRENEQAALTRLIIQTQRLATAINNLSIEELTAYTKLLDTSADLTRAKRVLSGLSNIKHALENSSIQYAMKCNDYFDDLYPAPMGYGWIDDSEDSSNDFPSIYFCRGFEDNVKNKIGWHFHELSHFHPPFGMNTDDHSYRREDCEKWAIQSPDKAIDNATCITLFLSSDTT